MQIDALHLVVVGEHVVVHAIVKLPGVSALVDFGREDTRQHMLHHLQDRSRMQDDEVDRIAGRGSADIAASGLTGGSAVILRDRGVEAGLILFLKSFSKSETLQMYSDAMSLIVFSMTIYF